MGSIYPAVVQCSRCGWWWYFYDKRPTMPFTCVYCKEGVDPWPVMIRTATPAYGIKKMARRKKDP